MNVAPHNQVRLHWQRAGFELAVDLSLPATGITVLFGASGSGKTTLLRCVAGLERAQHARVQIGDEVWQDDDARIFVPTWRRALGYVFQEASLFEHLTVQQNLRYGLRRSGQKSASDALDAPVSLLGIGHLLITHHHPNKTDADLLALEAAATPVTWAREGRTYTLAGNTLAR